MNANQLAWIYMLKEGTPNVKPSYYGGYDLRDEKDIARAGYQNKYSGSFWQKYRDMYLAEVRKHGINWYRTVSPQEETISEFAGTFADSSTRRIMVGTIKLNNGTEITYHADFPDASNVFEWMANRDEFVSGYEWILNV